jgi:hypothetical protein
MCVCKACPIRRRLLAYLSVVEIEGKAVLRKRAGVGDHSASSPELVIKRIVALKELISGLAYSMSLSLSPPCPVASPNF